MCFPISPFSSYCVIFYGLGVILTSSYLLGGYIDRLLKENCPNDFFSNYSESFEVPFNILHIVGSVPLLHIASLQILITKDNGHVLDGLKVLG